MKSKALTIPEIIDIWADTINTRPLDSFNGISNADRAELKSQISFAVEQALGNMASAKPHWIEGYKRAVRDCYSFLVKQLLGTGDRKV